MKFTTNLTHRRDLKQNEIKVSRTNAGIRFGIYDLDEMPFDDTDKVIIFAKDRLYVEILRIRTVGYLKKLTQDEIYPITDKSVLESDSLKIDVQIINKQKFIRSRTSNISLAFGNDRKKGQQNQDIPFKIKQGKTGKDIYRIEDDKDLIICKISDKLPNLCGALNTKNSQEFALLGPHILKDAFMHALVYTDDEETSLTEETLQKWKDALLEHIDYKELPDNRLERLELIKRCIQSLCEKWDIQGTLEPNYKGAENE